MRQSGRAFSRQFAQTWAIGESSLGATTYWEPKQAPIRFAPPATTAPEGKAAFPFADIKAIRTRVTAGGNEEQGRRFQSFVNGS